MDRQRLLRVFSILSYLSVKPSTLSEVSKSLGLPLSSSHDLLQALLELDAVSLEGRVYSLGPRSIGLAITVQNSIGVVGLSRRFLEQLARDTQLDVYLAVRTGTSVVYAMRYPDSQVVNIDIPMGRRLFLHSTAVGKLFAALDPEIYERLVSDAKPALTPRTRTTMQQLDPNLSCIRSQQISISHGESVAGVVGVAVPVRDPSGQLIAAAHVSVLAAGAPPGKIKGAIVELRAAAQAIEVELRRISEPISSIERSIELS
jgi:IclR family transcriptional regulator, acetate operon repressor